ncbi:MAG: hypothetical protein HQL83_11475 [Magnetococcales bacterium]|nr:hypothetical protein [Magnetococcales bacterium]
MQRLDLVHWELGVCHGKSKWLRRIVPIFLSILLLCGFGATETMAARISDVRGTFHNLSSINYAGGPTRTVKASSEDQVCVFCHTPHGALQSAGVNAPLWNRQLSGATYTKTYESTSIDADINELRQGPGGTSKLCLSCHDGTMALSAVSVLGGNQSVNINMTGTGAGNTMPGGASGANTGFTRNLGVDLSNDHPISFTFNAALATADGELRSPPFNSNSKYIMGLRQTGVSPKPMVPLDEQKVQCASCHDPHIRDPNESTSIKFLRLNRFQKTNPSGSTFNDGYDIICLACHNKGVNVWATSVHANSTDAGETYKSGVGSAGAQREFPSNLAVWEAACLNCHDTHTVPGARRLLREGNDSASSPKSSGNAALEETCYQCHNTSSASILNSTANSVPDIKTDFTTVGNKHMPIASADQTAGSEVHSIGANLSSNLLSTWSGAPQHAGANFVEDPLLLGKGNLNNRHVECTDCHNPHRALKNSSYTGGGSATQATHNHSATVQHSNTASGVLRGVTGVEPVYVGTSFGDRPTSFKLLCGDPTNPTDCSMDGVVTKEYQVCLKCHSDYAYDDGGGHNDLGRPAITGTKGLSLNNFSVGDRYTNQAMEFQAPVGDQGEKNSSGTEPTAVNHRSWHPVMNPTLRTLTERGGAASDLWLSPWNGSSGGFIGNQTIYCTDCHGSTTANGVSTPNAGSPWGPHGSSSNFILKGPWSTSTGSGQQDGLCFKCHDYNDYAVRGGSKSGFCCEKDNNLHGYHADKIGKMRCNWCHVAVPHGWKNKAFLVNLNDAGPEVGLAAGTQVRNGTTTVYSRSPYYMNSILKVKTWPASGQWTAASCGSKGAPGNNTTGRSWMRDSSENCTNPP